MFRGYRRTVRQFVKQSENEKLEEFAQPVLFLVMDGKTKDRGTDCHRAFPERVFR